MSLYLISLIVVDLNTSSGDTYFVDLPIIELFLIFEACLLLIS